MTYTEAKAIIRHWRHMTAWGDPNRDLIHALVRKEAEIQQLKAEVKRLALFVALHSATQPDTRGTGDNSYRISFTDPTAQGTAIAPPDTQDGR